MPARSTFAPLLDEGPAHRRRLVLMLYAAVLPPFAALLAYLSEPAARVWSVAAVLTLCLLAAALVAVSRTPTSRTWLLPIVAPTLSCGIAFAATHQLAFLAVMLAPLAWASSILEASILGVVAAAGALVCFTLQARAQGPLSGALGAALYAIVATLMGTVVFGKARRQREARLRVLEKQINEAELILRSNGDVLEANDRAATTYGYSRGELLGMNIRRLRRPGEGELVGEQMRRSLTLDGMLFETEHVRRDGSRFAVEVSSRHFTVAGETFLHSIVRDVSLRKALEAERDRLLAEAEATSRDRQQLLAIVAHELRNPLTAIELTATTTGAESGPGGGPEVGERMELIQSASGRMRCLVEDLLDVSSLQAGRLRAEPKEEDPVSIAREAARLAESQASHRHVALVLELEITAPVRCDRGRILQVLANLLTNAIHHTPAGGTVTLRVEDQGTQAHFAVVDTGSGVAEEDLPRLFSPYFRAKETQRSGTGLGLAIAKGIVEAQGGTIWAQREPGMGAAFHFTLPFADAAEEG